LPDIRLYLTAHNILASVEQHCIPDERGRDDPRQRTDPAGLNRSPSGGRFGDVAHAE